MQAQRNNGKTKHYQGWRRATVLVDELAPPGKPDDVTDGIVVRTAVAWLRQADVHRVRGRGFRNKKAGK
jgi:hypothetical protein